MAVEELVKGSGVQLSFPAFEINNRAAKVGGSCDPTRYSVECTYMRNGLQQHEQIANCLTKSQQLDIGGFSLSLKPGETMVGDEDQNVVWSRKRGDG